MGPSFSSGSQEKSSRLYGPEVPNFSQPLGHDPKVSHDTFLNRVQVELQ